MKDSCRISTSHIFHIEENNSKAGGLQNSSSPGSGKPFEQEGHFEYFSDRKEAIKKYHMLARVEDQNLSCIIGFDWRNKQRSIMYQATKFSLEDIISNKALFWEFDAKGESTCMTNDLRKFLIAIWEGLLSLNQQNIGIQYAEDFKMISLVDRKLSEPKFYIQKVTEFTDKVEDLKQKAAILMSIILGIRRRQGLLTSYRGLENLEKVLDVISCCPTPMEALKFHPEISGTDGILQNMNEVYDRWISNKAQMKIDMKAWFKTVRGVHKAYSCWSSCLDNGDVAENPYGFRVKSMFEAKKARYILDDCALEPNCDVDYISGLVILMRDLFNHANDDVTEPEDEMTDEDIFHYFDTKFPSLCFELHHYLYKINPAR